MIIATAGHVDHGKTAVVKAITGVDTDRLIEEKKRGLSIDLGFAYLPLNDGSTLGFVDVPGHQRFIGNMLAGVANIDAALIIIAADDGLMPQTYEHITILDLIGIRRGIIAITKSDLVTSDRVNMVSQMARSALKKTKLSCESATPISTLTGEGVKELYNNIISLNMTHTSKMTHGNFRMTIDRAFQIRGSGLIITGTVTSGSIAPGDRLKLRPGGPSIRVRTVHAQNSLCDHGKAGDRVGLNIVGQGIRPALAGRGNWLVSEHLHSPTNTIDTKLHLIEKEEKPIVRPIRVHIHIGTKKLLANVKLVDRKDLKPGASGYAQIKLNHSISALYGDRFIIRDFSASRTIGGGYIIDPFANSWRFNEPKLADRLRALDHPDTKEALRGLLKISNYGTNLTRFDCARNISYKKDQHPHIDLYSNSINTKFGQIVYSSTSWKSLIDHIKHMLNRNGGPDNRIKILLDIQKKNYHFHLWDLFFQKKDIHTLK